MHKYSFNFAEKEIGKEWSTSISSFILDKRLSNCREQTLVYYEDTLKIFSDFLKTYTSPEGLKKEHIDKYILYMLEVRNNKHSSVNIRLRAIRAFVNYLKNNGSLNNPNLQIKLLKTEEVTIKSFSEKEISLMIKKPKMSNMTFAKYRDYSMVCFLLGTGVRLSSMTAIKVSDIDFEKNEIIIKHTKSRREQTIPIDPHLQKVLFEYISLVKHQPEDYLFCSVHGKKLAKRTVEDRFKSYCLERGLDNKDKRLSPHTCRHTFAIFAVRSGMDIFTLQKLLGHSSLEMVRKYVNLSTADLHKGFYSPLSVRKSKSLKK